MEARQPRGRLVTASACAAGPAREWLAVDFGTDETLSTADLLRLLDGLRRDLSCHLAGSPGASSATTA